MSYPKIDIGMTVVAKPPLALVQEDVSAAQDAGFDTIMAWDHVQDFYPSALWDEHFSYYATENASPHTWFDYQTLLGYLAAITNGPRLGVGVTEPLRRHPIVIAQAAITLAQSQRTGFALSSLMHPSITGTNRRNSQFVIPNSTSLTRPCSPAPSCAPEDADRTPWGPFPNEPTSPALCHGAG